MGILHLVVSFGVVFIIAGTIILASNPNETNFEKSLNYKNINGTVYDNIVEVNECNICINLVVNKNINNINSTITSSMYCDKKLNKVCYNIYVLFKTDDGNCAASALEYELDPSIALNQINNTYKEGSIHHIYYKTGNLINIKGFTQNIQYCFIGTNNNYIEKSYIGIIILTIGCFLVISSCFTSCCVVGRSLNIQPLTINNIANDATPNVTPDVTPYSSPKNSMQIYSERDFNELFNDTIVLENSINSYQINMPNKINNV